MLSLLFCLSTSTIIGFDIGTEKIKALVMRNGKQTDIVLSEMSKRFTPSIVSFEFDGEISVGNIKNVDRRIGDAATAVLLRNRSAVINGFTEIIGKSNSEDLQKHLLSRHYEFTMNGSKANGIEPQVALSMIFKKLQRDAEKQLNISGIRDAVIAVPSYFTLGQRATVVQAAKLAGLNVLKITDEKTATAHTFGIEKTTTFARSASNVAIVDFGAGKISIAGYKFSAKIDNKRGRSPRPQPKIEELCYVWDDTLGGIDFDVRLAEMLIAKYNLPKINTLILNDAQRLKHALTLGERANITIESVNERLIYTQAEFHELCADLINRTEELAKSLNRTFDSVEFIGGASRIPIVQDRMSAVLGKQTRLINQDEACVLGAAYIGSIIRGEFKLVEVQHSSLNVLSMNASFGQQPTRLFAPNSIAMKVKTVRFDASNETAVTVFYDSKIPIGADRIVRNWEVVHEDEVQQGSRLALTFGLDESQEMIMTKSVIFAHDADNKTIQIPISVRELPPPYRANEDEIRAQRELADAFAANDFRVAKISEARNTYESLVLELRTNLTKDANFLKVSSDYDKKKMNEALEESLKWLEVNTEFDDEAEIVERTRKLEKLLEDVRYRANEITNIEGVVQELEYLLNDMQDAVITRWPANKMKVPRQQKSANLNHIRMTREWLERMQEEQAELEPWDDPVLKVAEVERRIKMLGDAYKNLEDDIINNRIKSNIRADDDEDEDEFGADL